MTNITTTTRAKPKLSTPTNANLDEVDQREENPIFRSLVVLPVLYWGVVCAPNGVPCELTNSRKEPLY